MSIESEQLRKYLAELMKDHSVPTNDRCDALIFQIVERGLDMRPVLRELLEQAEAGRKVKEKLAAQQGHALVPERFIGVVDKPRLYAQVTRGNSIVWLPATPEQVEGLKAGDPVLIDGQTNEIVGRDGQLPVTGEVVQVASLPVNQPGRIYVKRSETLSPQLAWLHHQLLEDPEACLPGTQLVYDPLRNFALEVAETSSTGKELLADLGRIEDVRRGQLACPKPVVDEIVARVKIFVEYPQWAEQLGARMRCAYCFIGGTGCGKSYHLKLIGTEVHDYLEQVIGQRVSRLVICDASQFWRSLFGETEQMITNWAAKLQKLAAMTLRARDGREIAAPLIVVLEECDTLLRTRGDQTGSGHLFDRPLAHFLQQIESFGSTIRVPVIWVATTNRPDLVDPASLRRVGMRTVFFGTLSAEEAAAVLAKKVPETMPIRAENGRCPGSRDGLLSKVLGYLYGPEPKQPLAEVHFVDSERRILNRYDVVTPALLEEALSAAIDSCLMRSLEAGVLLGIDADDIIRFLHRHFNGLAMILRPHNVAEHCPEWFAENSIQAARVVPLARRQRRPPALLVR